MTIGDEWLMPDVPTQNVLPPHASQVSLFRMNLKIGDVEIDEKGFMAKVWAAAQKRRRYAGHREGGAKHVKERATVCEFLRAQETLEGRCWIRTVQANPDRSATPDCFGINILGGVIAYEVTELVDRETIELNPPKTVAQPRLYTIKEWQPEELIQKVQAILEHKDSRDFKGAIFEKVVLLIHTDEPALKDGGFTNLLMSHPFSRCRKIHEAFLLLPFGSRRRDYPYVRLHLG